MLTQTEKKQIWNELYNSARCARYYESLAGKYQLAYNIFRVLLLLPLFSGIALFMEILPSSTQIILGVVIAVLVALELVFNLSKNSIVLHSISVECSKLENEFHLLWLEVHSAENDRDTIMAKFVELSQKFTDSTSQSSSAIVYNFTRLNEKCGRDASNDLMERYKCE